MPSAFTGMKYYFDLLKNGIRVIKDEGCQSFFRKVKLWLLLKRMSSKRQKNILPGYKKLQDIRDAADIIFPQPPTFPEVSIIIPVYNKWQYTLNCLKSVSINTKGDYEVIVVDDASTDETLKQLKVIPNIRIIQNEQNKGFLDSCNAGAEHARGKYILFLNNDTVVTDNWLTPLLEVMRRSDTGAAGVKLVYPDGTLQEAGSIIWDDGTPWVYGRGQNADRPEYNYLREVDYCSGACLIVKRELFNSIGGFDIRYRPGYFEDTDLCYAIIKLGYKVIYQPASVVIHFEGITSGIDLNQGMKKYQEINYRKFIDKWNLSLKEGHFNRNEVPELYARNKKAGMQILVIDLTVPMHDRDSGSLRMFNILKILSESGNKVTFASDMLMKVQPYTMEMEQLGVEVLYMPHVNSIKSYLEKYGKYFDLVVLSRFSIADKYIKTVKKFCNKARIIFDTVDLAFLRESRRALVENNQKLKYLAEEYKKKELELAKNSDITFVVSSVEKEILLEINSNLNVEVVSNIHNVLVNNNSFKDRKDILFIGNFEHNPNTDAVIFFMDEIYTHLIKMIPELKFYIAGNRPGKQITAYGSDKVIVTGFVKDVSWYFQNCRVFVSPLRYGSGVKGKINQSFSYGLPVVSTSIGAEGMGVQDGEDILIANEPEDFAKQVALLYTDEELWSKISRNAIKNIENNFSVEVARNKISALLNTLKRESERNG